ncbi:MAG: hypothetical protein CM15mP74_33890 [Halieaceae bacterium]|nr:MAG: hypothetical protein CM15mP74_33890 [Halieaceae bacterium]
MQCTQHVPEARALFQFTFITLVCANPGPELFKFRTDRSRSIFAIHLGCLLPPILVVLHRDNITHSPSPRCWSRSVGPVAFSGMYLSI